MNIEELYEISAKELEVNAPRKGLFAQAFAEALGDGAKAKAIYMRLRVEQLQEQLRQKEEEDQRRLSEARRQQQLEQQRRALASNPQPSDCVAALEEKGFTVKEHWEGCWEIRAPGGASTRGVHGHERLKALTREFLGDNWASEVGWLKGRPTAPRTDRQAGGAARTIPARANHHAETRDSAPATVDSIPGVQNITSQDQHASTQPRASLAGAGEGRATSTSIGPWVGIIAVLTGLIWPFFTIVLTAGNVATAENNHPDLRLLTEWSNYKSLIWTFAIALTTLSCFVGYRLSYDRSSTTPKLAAGLLALIALCGAFADPMAMALADIPGWGRALAEAVFGFIARVIIVGPMIAFLLLSKKVKATYSDGAKPTLHSFEGPAGESDAATSASPVPRRATYSDAAKPTLHSFEGLAGESDAATGASPVPRRRALFIAGIVIAGLLAAGIAVRAANERAQAAAKRPAVVALAIEPWGEVVIDGTSRGRTPPLARIEVSPGRHTIEIRHPPQPPLTLRLELDPGEELALRHSFATPAATSVPRAPRPQPPRE